MELPYIHDNNNNNNDDDKEIERSRGCRGRKGMRWSKKGRRRMEGEEEDIDGGGERGERGRGVKKKRI